MRRVLGLGLMTVIAFSASALAAPERIRVRGTVASVSVDTVTVHAATGDIPLIINNDTKVVEVVKQSLEGIEKGSYIGVATKTEGSALVALEVVVFPPAMKGAGEGHYAWDKMPDTTATGTTGNGTAGNGTTDSTMTNGTVTASTAAPMVSSMMTNGDVAAATSQGGSKKLTVTYKGGEQTILVPTTTPVVTFKPGTIAEVTKGVTVFVGATKDGDKATATFVAVGTGGVKPPM